MCLLLARDMGRDAARILDVLLPIQDFQNRVWLFAFWIPQMDREDERVAPRVIVEDYLGQLNVPFVRVPNADGNKAALFATVGPMHDGGIVLSGHTDVVPVAGQPPANATVEIESSPAANVMVRVFMSSLLEGLRWAEDRWNRNAMEMPLCFRVDTSALSPIQPRPGARSGEG